MQDARNGGTSGPNGGDEGRDLVTGHAGLPASPSTHLRSPGYPQMPMEEAGDDLAATIHYYLRLILKRKWLIAGLALLFVTVGGLYYADADPALFRPQRVSRSTGKGPGG